MKKNKNDGFFLSETMVVITIVAVVLLGVFKIFSSVYIKYKESENYNTINALNIVTSMDNYYKALDINYNTVIGSNSYVDITNYDTNDTEYYTNLKETIGVNKIYLIDMSKIFTGTNISTFNVSLRKYLNTLQSKNLGIIILVVTSNNEYGYIKTSSGTNVTLVGDANDEYSVLVPIGGAFTDPGYENWSGDSPTITWETPLNVNVKGTYYLRYNFNGYLLRRKVVVGDTIYNYSYTGDVQTFTVPVTGWYQIETWGAQGASSKSLGAYVSGKIFLQKSEVLYIYVGEGLHATSNTISFNGGTGNSGGYNGGGATDIRLTNGNWNDSTSINSRIMVAGGSGSGTGNSTVNIGYGGGLFGGSGGGTSGGTQITYGAVQSSSYTVSYFGIANGGCSGGNGYYPGGGATCANGAGGGSSFISGYAGANAIEQGSTSQPRSHTNNTLHYSKKYFIDGAMTAGNNNGNGKAKIAYIGAVKPKRINAKLDNVRYIKDCTNGNSINTANHWVELQAIMNGQNIAKNILATGITNNTSYPITNITNGDLTYQNFAEGGTSKCITVDLGKEYNLDEIAVWHYWSDGRTYNDNITYVSSDNTTWTTAINRIEGETSQGKRVNAYSYKNLVLNGSLISNKVNGWSTSSTTTTNTVNGTISKEGLYITDTSTSAGIWNYYSFTPIENHIYYASMQNKSSVGGFLFGVRNSSGIFDSVKTTITTDYTTYSLRFTAPVDVLRIQLGSSVADVSTSYTKNIALIDLTDIFGAGNEPTKEWCDENIVPNVYYE